MAGFLSTLHQVTFLREFHSLWCQSPMICTCIVGTHTHKSAIIACFINTYIYQSNLHRSALSQVTLKTVFSLASIHLSHAAFWWWGYIHVYGLNIHEVPFFFLPWCILRVMSSSLLMPWGHAYIKDDVIDTINAYIDIKRWCHWHTVNAYLQVKLQELVSSLCQKNPRFAENPPQLPELPGMCASFPCQSIPSVCVHVSSPYHQYGIEVRTWISSCKIFMTAVL